MLTGVTIDWPTSNETGEIFDLEWLDAGTRKPVSEAEERIILAAAEVDDPESILWVDSVPSYVRTEYIRRVKIFYFGRHFLHQPAHVLHRGDVRGVFYLEWDDHIDHLKRTGHLEEALALTYEVIDAAERVNGGDAAGWYSRAAVILRKLRDYDSEVRLIEQVTQRLPARTDLLARLPTARRLAAQG